MPGPLGAFPRSMLLHQRMVLSGAVAGKSTGDSRALLNIKDTGTGGTADSTVRAGG